MLSFRIMVKSLHLCQSSTKLEGILELSLFKCDSHDENHELFFFIQIITKKNPVQRKPKFRSFFYHNDFLGEGGEMTKYLSCSSSFRSKRPRTEMLYSQKTEQEYPPNKKYSMVDLICIISYFKVCNDEHVRSAYIFNKKQLCAVFEDAESPGENFLTARNFKTFREIADQIWQDDRIINGLAKYEGRSYFMMQTIKKSGLSQCLLSLKKTSDFQLSPKSRIEACFHHRSRFWVLVTNYQTDQKRQSLSIRKISENSKKIVLRPNELISCMCLALKLLDGYKMLLVTEQLESFSYDSQLKVKVHNMFLYVLRRHGFKVPPYVAEICISNEMKIVPKPRGVEFFILY